MERIEFSYHFDDANYPDEKCVVLSKRDKHGEGLQDYDICEMFLDFMRAAGFSEKNIFKYFNI